MGSAFCCKCFNSLLKQLAVATLVKKIAAFVEPEVQLQRPEGPAIGPILSHLNPIPVSHNT